MLNRDLNIWYVRWYFVCIEIINRFFHGTTHSRALKISQIKTNGTDLCKMSRTILFGTFLIIFNYLAIAFALYSFIVLPLMIAAGEIAFGILIIVSAFAAIVALCFIFDAVYRILHKLVTNILGASHDNIVASYISGIKNKYCVIVKFKDNENV